MITSTNVANAIVKLVATDALPSLVGNLVLGNLVNRDYEPTLAQSGDTVNIPIPPIMTANNVAEGGSVTPQSQTVNTAQIVLNTHAEATFQIPDVTKAIAHPDLMRIYMEPAVIALAEKIEKDLMALYSQFTANTPVGVGNTALTESVIDQAETALFNAKVPASQKKFLVLDANAYSTLRQLPRFSEAQTIGDSAISNGALGRIKDFQVFRSHYVAKTGTSTVTTHNLAFARDAMGLVIRRLPQPIAGTGAIAEYAEFNNFGIRTLMSYAPNTLAQQFTVDVLYGVAVLRNNFGVKVLS